MDQTNSALLDILEERIRDATAPHEAQHWAAALKDVTIALAIRGRDLALVDPADSQPTM